MRILGFSKHWAKLEQKEFSTFRFHRRDRDWQVGELVQIVYKPRSKEREKLGVAEIASKELRGIVQTYNSDMPVLSEKEAREDGFANCKQMYNWLAEVYGYAAINFTAPMNKLTLRWVNK